MKKKKPEVCEWMYNNSTRLNGEKIKAYYVDCLENYAYMDNCEGHYKFIFCPYCGRKIRVKK